MYRYSISDTLQKVLKKIFKKDKVRYETTLNKIQEIINSNPYHYKNLRYNLKDYKRVHINSHFVLIFRVDEKNKVIYFEYLAHHDDVYIR